MSSDLLLGLRGQVKTLLDRLTAARANLLDNLSSLDASILSRAPASDTGTLLTRLTDPRAKNLDYAGYLRGLGPPTGSYRTPKVAKNLQASLSGCMWSEQQNIGSGSSWVEMLNLAGPGICSFLAVTSSNSVEVANLEYELTIDGVQTTGQAFVSDPGSTDGSGYTIIGAVSRSGEDGSGNDLYAVVPEPVYFASSFLLRCRHGTAGTRSVEAYFSGKPV